MDKMKRIRFFSIALFFIGNAFDAYAVPSRVYVLNGTSRSDVYAHINGISIDATSVQSIHDSVAAMLPLQGEAVTQYPSGAYDIDVTVNTDHYKSAYLDPGQEYTWTVETLDAKAPVKAQASFRVLSLAELTDLREKESRIKAAYGSESTETLVSLALLYKSFGLEKETDALVDLIKERRGQR